LPKVYYQGQAYIIEKWLYRTRNRSSWIKNHGFFLARLDGDGNLDHTAWWFCKYCLARYKANATSSAKLHLNGAHLHFESSQESDSSSHKRGLSINTAIQEGARRQKAEKEATAPVFASEADLFHQNLVQWIIAENLPFRVVEHPRFRQILMQIDAQKTAILLPESSKTIRRWI
ncbi:hypothetical protein V8F06_014907, partial [Rhypophila decipiens]